MQNHTSTHNRQLLLQSICLSPCTAMAIGRITKPTRIRSKPSTEESDREGQRQRGRPDGERRAARGEGLTSFWGKLSQTDFGSDESTQA